MSKSDVLPPWFWQRKDLYRDENGQCWYLDMCGKVECGNDPSDCEQFDNFFDGECLADEILLFDDA